MKVICIGQATYDVTLVVNRFLEENEKIRVNDKVECGGGSASNCSYLLKKWGIDSYFAGTVGKDYYGNKIKEEFDEVGVNTKYLSFDKDASTATSYIICNTSNGSRTILSKRDNKLKYNKKYDKNDKFDYIFLDGYEGELAREVIKNNPDSTVLIDAGSLKEDTIELCKLADYIVCSHDFAESYSNLSIDTDNIKSLIDAYEAITKDFDAKVIITLEDKGCFTYDDGYKLVPSIKVIPKDSTGAGDIYHAAFLYFLIKDNNLLNTMKVANITGAISVERVGARNSIPTKKEVMDRYNAISKNK